MPYGENTCATSFFFRHELYSAVGHEFNIVNKPQNEIALHSNTHKKQDYVSIG